MVFNTGMTKEQELTSTICSMVEKALVSKPLLITIDGPCASGKTTLAGKLSAALSCDVLHTDDFVVPHARKTAERLSVPGGTVIGNG